MDNSFAIWHEKQCEIEEISNAELHFNFWQFSSKNGGVPDFLDIGIKIEEINKVSSINLFVPFQLQKSDICDLGETISNNQDLLIAIFNERTGVGGNYLTGIAGNLWKRLFNKNGNRIERINKNEQKSIIPPIEMNKLEKKSATEDN